MNMQKTKPGLKVGILGSRGIPNYYGGYEQFAQHLSVGLTGRGHEVWVYNSSRHPYRENSWNGVHLVRCPDPEDVLGTAGQFVYDFHCLRDARRRQFDILLQLGYTSSAIWRPMWPPDAVNIVHMDGLEWKRTKYTAPVRFFLKNMERSAARHGDVLVADSVAIQTHLQRVYGRRAVFIPYGAPIDIVPREEHLPAFGLKPHGYFLAVARFVPENNLETIIAGYLENRNNLPMVVIGDVDSRYGRFLAGRYAGRNVLFPGSVFDPEILNSVRHYSRLYFHGHSVGGTNPSLLEAMACGAPICAHDNPFNRAVLEQRAFFFQTPEEVSRAIAEAENYAAQARNWACENQQKIRESYRWEQIIDSFEYLFLNAIAIKTGT
jgi:glycosyltransferase involved in cell wall biosynthesis